MRAWLRQSVSHSNIKHISSHAHCHNKRIMNKISEPHSVALNSLPASDNIGWSSSCVYRDFQPREWEKFLRLQHKRRRRGSCVANSPFVPGNIQEWIEHRLAMVQESIEVEKAKISACQEGITSGVYIMPAFGSKLGMLRSMALSHRLNQVCLYGPEFQDEVGYIETEAFQARAKELIGADLFSRL